MTVRSRIYHFRFPDSAIPLLDAHLMETDKIRISMYSGPPGQVVTRSAEISLTEAAKLGRALLRAVQLSKEGPAV